MTSTRSSSAHSEALTTQDFVSALSACFDQAGRSGLSIADYFEINRHNRARAGRLGGAATKKRYGREHFKRIGRLGGQGTFPQATMTPLPVCNDPTHPECFMRWLRANTRVLSRSKNGMSVTIGVDHDYSKYVHFSREQ